MGVLKLYQSPALSEGRLALKCEELRSLIPGVVVQSLKAEYCFYIESIEKLSKDAINKLIWILQSSFKDLVTEESSYPLVKENNQTIFIEIGPRLNFSTAFSTNATSICWSVGLRTVKRFERSIRYIIEVQAQNDIPLSTVENLFIDALHDRMTECHYTKEIKTFDLQDKPKPWEEVDLLKYGRKALEDASKELGLAFDEWDLDFYTDMFCNKLKRNPTTVECFDLAQSNSEHSRHWFFKGRMVIDGTEVEESLFDIIVDTQKHSNQNNVIKFSDNSSAILGYEINFLKPSETSFASPMYLVKEQRDIIFTAETHNFPTGVAPFSGATTGTGGRLRDVQAAGRGAHVIAGTAAYCFGNLNIPGYELPWEDKTFEYPSNFAKPLTVAVEASNGASDYGNKFGEPVLCGFARSFGMKLANGERREWIKPIMFSGGIGSISHDQISKFPPEKGMLVVKVGGPIYRIGVGGGSASSVHVQGDQETELDFGAVQRGDPEMEQKLNRVIRSCLERRGGNIICSIHDQGAGGNGNVLKELVEPAGAEIFTNSFQLGDPTISTLELWGAEYQESDAILISSTHKSDLEAISIREKCPVSFVGTVTGDGRVVLKELDSNKVRHPFDMELSYVLGSMPRKVFKMESYKPALEQLNLPSDLTVMSCLNRVLRLPAVASKRYLTNKVDRSVTGLVAQQQCVGPLHTPLADVAVIALSHYDTVGSATSIGEQPIKGLINPAAGARMSVAEAITNLMFAKISSLKDVKCSGNWMWAAKLPGEGAALVAACRAMCEVMEKLGIAIDGGKDSLSMAARVGTETVKAPGAIVISSYAPCPDITKVVTPDIKLPNKRGCLIRVDLSNGKTRLGGSALAQCYGHLGSATSDLDYPELLVKGFNVTQKLIEENKITAGHDISDGGLITCVLEMAFAGNSGLSLNIDHNLSCDSLGILFAEEVGWVLEVLESDTEYVIQNYKNEGVPCSIIGFSEGFASHAKVNIFYNGEKVLSEPMADLREIWEETSYQLELRQCNPKCALAEWKGLRDRTSPPYKIPFKPDPIPKADEFSPPIRVAVVREEGTNGDREMISALSMAGFQVWDVAMTDLQTKKATLDNFRGVIFPGGFSFADVLGSAKGWAATFLFDESLKSQLNNFRQRKNTFSLGVCNGCQLLALLGWVSPLNESLSSQQGVLLAPNISERYESRFTTCKINKTDSIMLKGMENSILGVWVAHGEGRFSFKNESLLEKAVKDNLIVLSYVDDEGEATEAYPLNPNGSNLGIAGLCSTDGRHLAMMPHPERCILPWQWAWMPDSWKNNFTVSPWMQMFINAYNWCQN